MFLILISYKKSLTIVDEFLSQHRDYLTECYKQNYFIVSGPRVPRNGGIMLSQLKDKATLEKVIQQDPFSINDIADFEIIEFDPVKYHNDFVSFI